MASAVHHRRVLRWLIGSLSVLVVMTTTPVLAQSHKQSRSELARSRTLFEQGLAHAEAERWDEARAAFEAALAITERPSILLNLATAEAETGALIESARSYRRFLEIATGRDQRANRAEATRALAAVELRIAHLTLDASALAADDEIVVDDVVRDRDVIATPIAMNPGEHHVVVRRGRREVIDQRVTLADGEARTLALRAVDLRPARTTPPPDEVIGPPPVTGGGDDSLAIGLGVGLGVGALVIAGVIVGVVVATSSPSAPYQGNVGDGVIRF